MTKAKTFYAIRNIFVGGKPVAIGEKLPCSPAAAKALVAQGRASTEFPKGQVDAIKKAEKARRDLELAEDAAATEEFDAAVDAAVERILAEREAKDKDAAPAKEDGEGEKAKA